jgi:hypothetical protein
VVVGLGNSSVQYYNGSSWNQLHDDSWDNSVNSMQVNWTANDGPQVVVGLGNSAVEYYNGSSWSQLHDDSWDSSVSSMQVNWTANDGPQVVVGLGNGSVEYYNGSSWSQLQDDLWNCSVNDLEVKWIANSSPLVVVGLNDGAVEYYDESGNWNQLQSPGGSVTTLSAYWPSYYPNYGAPLVVIGMNDGQVEYYNGSGWSTLQGEGWGSAVDQASTQWNNASWGLANFQVNQSNAYLEMLANGSWSNSININTPLAGIAELANLPNLPWANGGPALSTNAATLNTGFGLGLNSAGQFVSVAVNQASDSYNSYLVQAPPIWAPQAATNSGDVSETFNNYSYDWSSIPFNVRDGRQNLAFTITSASQPINQVEPVYQQVTTPNYLSSNQLVPVLVEQTVYTTSTVNTLNLGLTSPSQSGAPVAFASLKGNNVTLTSKGTAANQLAGVLVASGPSLSVSSAGALQLGAAATPAAGAASGLTLVGQTMDLQGAGITVSGLLVGLPNDLQSTSASLSLDAGPGSLTLHDSLLAPVQNLTLAGASLELPTAGSVSAVVQAVNASFGATALSASAPNAGQLLLQLSGNGAGAPDQLVVTGYGAASGQQGGSQGGDQGIVLSAFSGNLDLALHTGAAVQLAPQLTYGKLLIDAAILSLTSTELVANGDLSLRLTGSTAVDFSDLIFTAPSVSLESFGGGQFSIDSPSISLASNQYTTVSQVGDGSTTVAINSGSAQLSINTNSDLLVSQLQGNGGYVNLSSGGNISLAQVSQTPRSALRLTTNNGSIILASGATANQFSFGSLIVDASNDITLEAQQLGSFEASSGGSISLVTDDPGWLALDSLQANGNAQVSAPNGSISLEYLNSISADAISLSAAGIIQMGNSFGNSLTANSSLTLKAQQFQTESGLNLIAGSDASGSNGTVWLEWLDLASADALASLPLITADQLALASASGLRLTSTSFDSAQGLNPFQTLAFLQGAAGGAGPSVPQYSPYRLESELLQDAAGVVYTYDSNANKITHYDSASGQYLFQALALAGSGLPQGVYSFSSAQPQVTTASQISSASSASGAINPNLLDLSTVLPLFRTAPSGTVASPISGPGTPLANALLQPPSGTTNQASTATTNPSALPAGYSLLPITPQLQALLNVDGVVGVTGSVQSSPLQGSQVWVDANGDWRHQQDEPLAQTRADGSFRLAVSTSLLTELQASGQGAIDPARLLLVASGGVDSLSGQAVPGLRLLGTAADGALTPLTTLATLLRLGGVNNEQIPALERAFGAALTSGDAELASFNPYASLASDGPRALRQVFSHNRLAALLLCIAPFVARDQLSPSQEASALAAAFATVAPALATATTPQAQLALQVSLLRAVLDRFDPGGSAAVHDALIGGYTRLAAGYAQLEARSAEATADELRPLLAASIALKGTLLQLFAGRLPELLNGGISADQWTADLNLALAQGGIAAPVLDDAHRVGLVPLTESALAGGIVLVRLELGSRAPDQGFGAQVFVEAPVGSQLADGSPATGGHQLLIAAGSVSTTLAIRIPTGSLSSNELKLRLVAVDPGFGLDPQASVATVALQAPGARLGETPVATAGTVGTAGNDLLEPRLGPAPLRGGAGADSFVLRRPAPGQGVDVIEDFNAAEGDRLLALRDRFPGASPSDFELLGGALLYRGEPIALVSRHGMAVTLLDELASHLQIVDSAKAVPLADPGDAHQGNGIRDLDPTRITPLLDDAAAERLLLQPSPATGQGSPGWSLQLSASGQDLHLAAGGDKAGAALITLRSLGAKLSAGNPFNLVVALLDGAGVPLRADGLAPATSLEQAVIAGLGAVSDDAGQLMFSGSSTQVNLRQGQKLRFGRRHNDGSIEWLKGVQLGGASGSMTLRFGDGESDQLQVGMELTNAVATASGLALPQKSGLGDLLYLQQGETLQIQLSSSCGNTNTYGLVRVDVDPLNGQLSVAGVAMHDAGAFRAAVRASMLPDLRLSQGGNRTTQLAWTVNAGDGYYAPVILTQLGDVFFPGDTINRDGHRHIRSLGDGVFAFEDLAADQNSDFDFNDGLLIVSRAPDAPAEYHVSSGEIAKPLYLSHDVHLRTGNANQLLHLFGDRNTVFSGGGNDTAILYGYSANLNLGAGADRVHLLSNGGGHQIDLGRDQAADRLYLYAPDGEQLPSAIVDFDTSRDQLILAGGNNASRFELRLDPTMASVLYDSKPLLQLLGSFDSSSLNTAVIRQSRTANDARQTIAERGLLMVEMESDLSGFSERHAGGLWYGYYVDQARTLAEQLTGSADRLVILPSTGQSNRQAKAVAQLASGRVDLALLGSGIDLDPGLARSVQGAADDRTVLQGLLVGSAITNLSALQGQPLGVLVDSKGVAAIETYLLDRGIRAQLQSFTDSTALMAAYRARRIQAIAGIEPLLQVYANRLGDGSRLLPDRFAPVPLGALVSAQQPGLRDLVESLLQLPQTAAELGLTQRSLELVLQQANLGAAERGLIDPAVRALLELDPQDPSQPVAHQGLGAALGLARGFSRALLRRLGNANELLSRHLNG